MKHWIDRHCAGLSALYPIFPTDSTGGDKGKGGALVRLTRFTDSSKLKNADPLKYERANAMSRKRIVLVLLLLGLLIVALHVLHPMQYEATAALQIRSVQQQFLSEDSQPINYDEFVHTQIALLRSAFVIDRVLDMPDVAKLPIVLKQTGRRAWLMRKLRVKREGKSEIITVSIATRSPDTSEKIVNAVVDVYLSLVDESQRQTDANMLGQLQSERQRLLIQAQQFLNSIRVSTQHAAKQGAEVGAVGILEILSREIALADVAMIALKAERKAVLERMEQLSSGALSILVKTDPKMASLSAQKEDLWQQKKKLNLDDPRGVQLLQEIKELEDKINKIAADADSDEARAVRETLHEQEGAMLYAVNQQIRTKEILIEALTARYNEQLVQNAERASLAQDTVFDQMQLDRTERTLARIDDRILAIRSEQRAPGRIIPLTKAVSNLKRGWW